MSLANFRKLDEGDQLALLDVLVKLRLLDEWSNLTPSGLDYIVTGDLPKLIAKIEAITSAESDSILRARLERLQEELAGFGCSMTFSIEEVVENV